MKIGYARVSTEDQITDLQRDALVRAGCDRIYEDKISGWKVSREGLAACLAGMAQGDTLVVWKLDRLGRSLKHLMTVIEDMRGRGIGLVSLTEGFDTTTPSGELMFHVIGALAQFERQIIRERVIAGLASTKAKGTVLGRRRVILDADVETIIKMDAELRSQGDIAKAVGISQSSVSRIIKERRVDIQPLVPLL